MLTTEEIVKHMVESIKEVNTVVQVRSKKLSTTTQSLFYYCRYQQQL